MEKKIKPHTMQTFQAVISECDLFAGRSGRSGNWWQLHQVGQQHPLGTQEGRACCTLQSCPGDFTRQTPKGAAPESV